MVLAIDATGPVVKLDLNRPDQGNAVTKAMMHEIIDACPIPDWARSLGEHLQQ